MLRVALRIVEVAILIPAFGLLIPSVPSEADAQPALFPGLAFGIVCVAISLGLACRRGAESWPIAVIKVLMFIGFGWLLHERVLMSQ